MVSDFFLQHIDLLPYLSPTIMVMLVGNKIGSGQTKRIGENKSIWTNVQLDVQINAELSFMRRTNHSDKTALIALISLRRSHKLNEERIQEKEMLNLSFL